MGCGLEIVLAVGTREGEDGRHVSHTSLLEKPVWPQQTRSADSTLRNWAFGGGGDLIWIWNEAPPPAETGREAAS